LGGLLEALREAAAIDSDFDEKFLKPYLEMRNEFVHRLTLGEGKRGGKKASRRIRES
jgi:hypothetical protein